jgi:Leucine-rich repeat (LRR) protein
MLETAGFPEGLSALAELESAWTRGRVVVARCRLGATKTLDSKSSSTKIHPANHPGYDSIAVVSSTRRDQRTHYLFSPEDLVPEFEVAFEYEIVSADRSGNRETLAGWNASARRFLEWTDPRFITPRCEKALSRLPLEVRLVARPMARFIGAAAKAERTVLGADGFPLEGEEVDSASRSAAAAFRTLASEFGFEFETHDQAIASLESKLRRRERIDVASRLDTDVSRLTRLDLHALGVSRIEPALLEKRSNLTTLVLAFNKISKLEHLDHLVHLQHLDASHNRIRRIENLGNLAKLSSLYLNDNELFRLEDLNALRSSSSSLRVLDLRKNALRESKAYAGLVLRRMTRLEVLDGVQVTESDRARAATSTTTLTAAMIKRNATFDTDFKRFFLKKTEETETETETVTETVNDERNPETDSDAWWPFVDSVTVRRRELRRLSDLEKLTNVRRVDFAQNEITRMEGFEGLAHLEILNLEDNRLTRIENVENLKNLRELHLARNRLSSVSNLTPHLAQLTRVSLEGNAITSLRGLAGLPALCELYVGDNAVTETREVFHLKQLPKLVILDLAGNPVCSENEYRPYVLYTLRRVKVLDAIGVDAREHAEARVRFAGRVTRDFLEVKFGRRHFRGVTRLDLRNARIKDVGDAFLISSEFDALETLEVDGNALRALGGLCALPRLAKLTARGNKIEANPLWTVEALRLALAAESKRLERRASPRCSASSMDRIEAAVNRTSLDDAWDAGVEASSEARPASEERRGSFHERAVALGGTRVFQTLEDHARAELANVAGLDLLHKIHHPADVSEVLRRKQPFPALRDLDLSACSISSASSLRLEPARDTLTTLDLRENDLTRLDGLEALRRLESLALDGNRLTFLEPGSFAGLGNLRELRMESNGLRALSHFETLVNLRALYLGGNRISEVSELEKLATLPELSELRFTGNPVTRKRVYRPMTLRHCEKMHTLDGIAVTALEREHVDYLFSPVDDGKWESRDGDETDWLEGGRLVASVATGDAPPPYDGARLVAAGGNGLRFRDETNGNSSWKRNAEGFASHSSHLGVTGSTLRAAPILSGTRREARIASDRGRMLAPVRSVVFGMGHIEAFAGAEHAARGAAPRTAVGHRVASVAGKRLADRAVMSRTDASDQGAETSSAAQLEDWKTFREKFPPRR